MFKKILIGHDDSPHAWEAFKVAADLAKKYGAKLYVVHVIDTRAIPVPAEVIVKPLRERAERLAKEIEEKKKELGLDIEYIVREGSPVEELSKVAEEKDVDLVVVGSRGLGMVSGYLLGSTSTKIAIACKKNVLIVKPKAETVTPLKP